MKDKNFDLDINKMIYQFNVESKDIDTINFTYSKIFTNHTCNINKDLTELTLKILLSSNYDSVKKLENNLNNKEIITQQIEDHINFIEVILFSSQVEKALYQLTSILWNNLWIFKKNDYLELKIKDFFVKLFDNHLITKYMYFIIFNYQSSRPKIIDKKEIELDINIDDIDYELDNINYSEFNDENHLSLDFLFFD